MLSATEPKNERLPFALCSLPVTRSISPCTRSAQQASTAVCCAGAAQLLPRTALLWTVCPVLPHCATAKDRYRKPGLSFCHLLSSVSSSAVHCCRHLLHIKTCMKHYCVILPKNVFELLDNYKHCKVCTGPVVSSVNTLLYFLSVFKYRLLRV